VTNDFIEPDSKLPLDTGVGLAGLSFEPAPSCGLNGVEAVDGAFVGVGDTFLE
jgi:hypothetical protein